MLNYPIDVRNERCERIYVTWLEYEIAGRDALQYEIWLRPSEMGRSKNRPRTTLSRWTEHTTLPK